MSYAWEMSYTWVTQGRWIIPGLFKGDVLYMSYTGGRMSYIHELHKGGELYISYAGGSVKHELHKGD